VVSSSSGGFERSWRHDQPDTGAGGEIRTLRLDHDLEMVGVARRELRHWLHELGYAPAEDAALVLSELVTNAIVHAHAGCTIEMKHDDHCLRLEVRDPSPTPPVIGAAHPHDIGGRGLHIVEAIANAWGWEPTIDGKTVWANLDAPVHPVGADDDITSNPASARQPGESAGVTALARQRPRSSGQ
jgi:anti-sigma regulatory factor (Ser/Thr protein kinase)